MSKAISISDYTGKGLNSLMVSIGETDIYFSYKTPVALRIGGKLYVRENDWKATTGLHLNAIDTGSAEAKARRLPSDQFENLMASVAEQTKAIQAII